jgi:hypothetical protein
MRPIILGMNNPLSVDPRHALYPWPAGCTGHRIWRLLQRRCQVSDAEYLEAFDRRNLVDGDWSAAKAVRSAEDLRMELTARLSTSVVLVLGEAPRRALGLPKILVHPETRDGVIYRQLPHPSGRCLWYNDETCADLAAMVLEELYESGKTSNQRK